MPRYAMIDLQTEIVGVEDANDPIAACRKLDERDGAPAGRGYEMVGGNMLHAIDGRSGYQVHEASGDFELPDQTPSVVEAVKQLPLRAIVYTTDPVQEAEADPAP